MSTEAALKALSNSELASGTEIPATKHRNVNDAIIEELFDAQSRGDVLAAVQSAVSSAGGDVALIIRSGEAYLIPLTEIGGAETLEDLTDTNIGTPLNNNVLTYDSSTSKWISKSVSDNIGNVTTFNEVALGTNPTTVDAANAFDLLITASTFTASTTLTFSSFTNLRGISMRLNNTNANVLTFAGITFNFKSIDLPSGVTFAANALTFPDDAGVDYNIVAVSFDDGVTYDAKIEIA